MASRMFVVINEPGVMIEIHKLTAEIYGEAKTSVTIMRGKRQIFSSLVGSINGSVEDLS
ncbi:hypothetical protein [Bacillus norwichensis]|uniref:Uncharacterized protein n=1 Tax=Bacillus norwichensis TaxID=2762217 RepID=A0ABR8VKU5_9BACI|nr:hypothetical protein [Bacillus norwichensis]MBD8005385.1 hypothetical protein [Bacillus norwichensis]